MPFHFATLAQNDEAFHVILDAHDEADVQDAIAQQEDFFGSSLIGTYPMPPSLDRFFIETAHIAEGEEKQFDEGDLSQSLVQLFEEGKTIMDHHASRLPPFVSAEKFLSSKKDRRTRKPQAQSRGCMEPLRSCAAESGETDPPKSYPSQAIICNAIASVEKGMRQRLREADGYSYYFVSAHKRKGKWNDKVVAASNYESMLGNLSQGNFGCPEPDVIHRLSPQLQLLLRKTRDMILTYDATEPDEHFGDRPKETEMATISMSIKQFKSWAESVREEGKKAFVQNTDVYEHKKIRVSPAFNTRNPDAQAGIDVLVPKSGNHVEVNAGLFQHLIHDLLVRGRNDAATGRE